MGWGVGFWDGGLGGCGLWFMVYGLGCIVCGFKFVDEGRFLVQSLGFRVHTLWFGMCSLWLRFYV